MIKVRLEDFMKGKYRLGAWSLYVVRDTEDYALYVGISRSNVSERWFGGLGHIIPNIYGGYYGNSDIGETIVQHMPASLGWTIELWTEPQLRQLFRKEIRGHPKRFNLRSLEDFMIIKTNPELNMHRPTLNDDDPRNEVVPDKYYKLGKNSKHERALDAAYDKVFNR